MQYSVETKHHPSVSAQYLFFKRTPNKEVRNHCSSIWPNKESFQNQGLFLMYISVAMRLQALNIEVNGDDATRLEGKGRAK